MLAHTAHTAHTAHAPSGAPADDVKLLRWPAQSRKRRQLAERGIPRLLVLARRGAPPEVTDELEDWIREPLDPEELQTRKETLRRRYAARPTIDDDGLLRVNGRWVALTEGQVAITRLLIGRLGRVVTLEEIVGVCSGSGTSVHSAAVRATVTRLATRCTSVGLVLHNVRGEGYVLAAMKAS